MCNALNIAFGNYPFTYLGTTISTKRLFSKNFNNLKSKANILISF